MYFEPHRLYLIVGSETLFDYHGNPLPTVKEELQALGGCFLHDVTVAIMRGYAGEGLHPKWYVNLDRRDDLQIGQTVLVTEADGVTVRARGKIVDIKLTSGMQFAGVGEYMTVYLE
jgi:hypothetical protein